LRLETRSSKLHASVLKQQINFVIRLLQLPASRLTRVSFNALIVKKSTDTKKYNWITGLFGELTRLNFTELTESMDHVVWIREKQNVVNYLNQIQLEEDITRARDSLNHQHCVNLTEGFYLRDIIPTIGFS
jgi:hypothetical protein